MGLLAQKARPPKKSSKRSQTATINYQESIIPPSHLICPPKKKTPASLSSSHQAARIVSSPSITKVTMLPNGSANAGSPPLFSNIGSRKKPIQLTKLRRTPSRTRSAPFDSCAATRKNGTSIELASWVSQPGASWPPWLEGALIKGPRQLPIQSNAKVHGPIFKPLFTLAAAETFNPLQKQFPRSSPVPPTIVPTFPRD